MKLSNLLAGALTLLLTPVLSAQMTYWVDAARGLDTNGGTYLKPFKSITMGCSILSTGDTLLILPGIYSATKTGESLPITLGQGAMNQTKIKIIAPYGPGVTVLDAEGNTPTSYWMMRFLPQANDSLISGLHFTNMKTVSPGWWDMALRLGSYSGGGWAVKNIEVRGCMFSKVNRGVVVWNVAGGGHKIHHNLFLNTVNDAFDIFGDHVNTGTPPPTYIYNNTAVNPATVAYLVDATCVNVTFANNIAYKGGDRGFVTDYTSTKVIFANNCAFGYAAGKSYVCKTTPNKSNWTTDPLFVDTAKDNYRLKPTSSLIGMGYNQNQGLFNSADFYGGAALFDFNGDGNVRADIGCHEVADVLTTITGTWAPGNLLTINHTAPSGYVAYDFFARDIMGLSFPLIGTFILDPFQLLPIQMVGPGSMPQKLPIPNIPELSGGIRIYIQTLYFFGKPAVKAGNILLGIL